MLKLKAGLSLILSLPVGIFLRSTPSLLANPQRLWETLFDWTALVYVALIGLAATLWWRRHRQQIRESGIGSLEIGAIIVPLSFSVGTVLGAVVVR